MTIGPDHVQSAQFGHAWPKLDVGAASGHVGRDSDGATLACPRDHPRLLLFVAGVQHLMREYLARRALNRSDSSTLRVPTRTGCPVA